jgi:UDP-N-acetylglucosamine--N-acetylmuramyl-(pentapeptide) pyrophosphoryl-undecaprenol N-acetylglucosamine transferase
MPVVLFAGGGTGGHLMPALAIADAMVAIDPTIEPFFVGAERGVEARVLPARPWRHVLLPFEPIYRNQWWKNYKLPMSMYRSFKGVRMVLRREEPVLAVGTGGYACGPSIWAAAGRGIPTVLQEQNAYPGYAIRRLAGRARQVHLGFPEGRAFLKPGAATEVLDTGNPIVPPPDILPDGIDARLEWGFAPEDKVVLVAGGSQGSLAINEAIAAALDSGLWPHDRRAVLIWQTGTSTFAKFSHHSKTGSVRVEAFIDPMAKAYAAADLVVGRAGAITSAEIAAWGLPSILIPLPTSAANHQLVNAQALAAAGAAVLLEQRAMTPRSLVDAITGVLFNPAKTADISSAARDRARPRAAHDIAEHALRLL